MVSKGTVVGGRYKNNTKPTKTEKEEKKPKVPIKIFTEIEKIQYVDFDEAMRSFLKGKYVAREIWKDYYFCKVNDHGNIMISDPKRYSYRIWVPTLEDLTKNDWIVIDK